MLDLNDMGFCVAPSGQEVLDILRRWGGAKAVAGEMAGLPDDTLEAISQDFKGRGGDLEPDTQNGQRRMLMLSQTGGKVIQGLNDLDKRIRSVSDDIVMS